MRRFRLPATVALAAVVLGLAAAAPAHGATIESLAAPAPVAALDGRVVWSRLDTVTGRYRLVQRAGGVVSELPVAPRGIPFDVDLGPDSRGRPVATYSRCAREPAAVRWAVRGTGCDVYRFDFGSGAESRIAGASTAAQSEFLPSLQGDSVAFVRIAADGRPLLYVRDLSSGASSRRLRGGTPDSLRRGDTRTTGPTRLDLSAAGLLFGWRAPAPQGGEFGVSEIRMDRVDGSVEVLDTGFEPECCVTSQVGSATQGSRGPLWTLRRDGEETGDLLRSLAAPARRLAQAAAPGEIESLAQDDDAVYQVVCAPEGGCSLDEEPRPALVALDEILATVPAQVRVSASGRWAAWSVPAGDGRWRLVLSDQRTGQVSAPPVATRPAPFDVDLGPGPDGATHAVYSRGGSLHELNVVTGRERFLRVPGTAPSLWRDQIAFVRRIGQTRIPYVRPFAGGRSVRVPGIAKTTPGAVAIDISGDRVATVTEQTTGADLWLWRRGESRARRIDSVRNGLLSRRLLSPSFGEGTLSWLRVATGEERQAVLRTRRLSTGSTEDRLAPLVTTSHTTARDQARRSTLYVRGDDVTADCTPAGGEEPAVGSSCEVVLQRAPFPVVRR